MQNDCKNLHFVIKLTQIMKKQAVNEILSFFKSKYPNPVPALNFNSTFELLIAVILSAQCTDERVNKVTAVLFKEYNTPQKILELGEEKLQKYIFSCGLYKSKARHIISACNDIIQKFNGEVPSDFNSLKSLAGVGQKTANVVSSVAFKKDAIAVDTHVFRVSNRIGLANAGTPQKTEEQLKQIIPKQNWSESHHYIIFYGREVCTARNPKCDSCEINRYCEYYLKNNGL